MAFFRKATTHKFKQIVLGDTGVGKSTLVASLAGRELPTPQPTLGCAFSTMRYNPKGRDAAIDLAQWDCAGQDRFTAVVDLYFRDVDVCFLVYDINRPTTLERIFQVWLPRFLESRHNNRSATGHHLFYLIGNKADQYPDYVRGQLPPSCRQIMQRNAAIIKTHRMECWCLSAYHTDSVQELAESIRASLMAVLLPALQKAKLVAETPDLILLTRQTPHGLEAASTQTPPTTAHPLPATAQLPPTIAQTPSTISLPPSTSPSTALTLYTTATPTRVVNWWWPSAWWTRTSSTRVDQIATATETVAIEKNGYCLIL